MVPTVSVRHGWCLELGDLLSFESLWINLMIMCLSCVSWVSSWTQFLITISPYNSVGSKCNNCASFLSSENAEMRASQSASQQPHLGHHHSSLALTGRLQWCCMPTRGCYKITGLRASLPPIWELLGKCISSRPCLLSVATCPGQWRAAVLLKALSRGMSTSALLSPGSPFLQLS
jgi:hypothetical protein